MLRGLTGVSPSTGQKECWLVNVFWLVKFREVRVLASLKEGIHLRHLFSLATNSHRETVVTALSQMRDPEQIRQILLLGIENLSNLLVAEEALSRMKHPDQIFEMLSQGVSTPKFGNLVICAIAGMKDSAQLLNVLMECTHLTKKRPSTPAHPKFLTLLVEAVKRMKMRPYSLAAQRELVKIFRNGNGNGENVTALALKALGAYRTQFLNGGERA